MIKQLIKFSLNHIPRPVLQRIAGWAVPVAGLFYKGRGAECPVCGAKYRKFMPYGYVQPRPNALCPKCLSLERHRLLWLTLLVALAAAAVAAWAGFDLGQRVDNQPVYEIVNDDYTRTVVIPATADAATQDDGTTGLYLPVPLKSGQRIYGVRLDLTTHNWAFRQGTLYAALLDADGNEITETYTFGIRTTKVKKKTYYKLIKF